MNGDVVGVVRARANGLQGVWVDLADGVGLGGGVQLVAVQDHVDQAIVSLVPVEKLMCRLRIFKLFDTEEVRV